MGVMMFDGTPECPIYTAVRQQDDFATARYMITVDEGWRSSILCADMYKWAAEWLVRELQGKPFAPDTAP